MVSRVLDVAPVLGEVASKLYLCHFHLQLSQHLHLPLFVVQSLSDQLLILHSLHVVTDVALFVV